MPDYAKAPEVEALAEGLIDTVDRHEMLAQCRIEYVFIDKAPKSKGRTVWGRARKLGGLPAFLIGSVGTQVAADDALTFGAASPMFVIEISHDIWVDLSPKQRLALVDHELCHCRAMENDAGELELSTVGHDVEEFVGIVSRHGLWTMGLTALGKVSAEAIAAEVEGLLADPAPGDGTA
jgi:hypothetical protein